LEAIGTHCILELYDCPCDLLDDEAFVTNALREAVEHGMATLLHEVSHHFHPQGVTALGLIAESHVAIHTWPEYGYAAADVFTCGNRAKAEKACLYLVGALKAGSHSLRKLQRGQEVARRAAREQRPFSAVPVPSAAADC
jgi:S-adenosylmethionine decarboxylase